MAAYLYGNITIHDMPLYEQYRSQVPAIIAKYGGRYLVRGGGSRWSKGMSMHSAKSFLNSQIWHRSKRFTFPTSTRQ